MAMTDKELQGALHWMRTGKREGGLVVTDEWLEESFKKVLQTYVELREEFDDYRKTIKSFETEFGLLLEVHKQAKREIAPHATSTTLVSAVAQVEAFRKKARVEERERESAQVEG
jgi:hypothetical protein